VVNFSHDFTALWVAAEPLGYKKIPPVINDGGEVDFSSDLLNQFSHS
jgi:hypothetical protein